MEQDNQKDNEFSFSGNREVDELTSELLGTYALAHVQAVTYMNTGYDILFDSMTDEDIEALQRYAG